MCIHSNIQDQIACLELVSLHYSAICHHSKDCVWRMIWHSFFIPIIVIIPSFLFAQPSMHSIIFFEIWHWMWLNLGLHEKCDLLCLQYMLLKYLMLLFFFVLRTKIIVIRRKKCLKIIPSLSNTLCVAIKGNRNTQDTPNLRQPWIVSWISRSPLRRWMTQKLMQTKENG